jgi:folylpolyglutamate synthase/dihydropteroate synthase
MLQTIASRFAKGTVVTSESSAEALRIALANTPREGLICIAGSLYLAGEMRPLILSLGES